MGDGRSCLSDALSKTMKVYGIDFTSTPSKSKPITCLKCEFDGSKLECGDLVTFKTFQQFEQSLLSTGPWVAGLDFPFGLPRKFLKNMGWSENWESYVELVAKLSRKEFRTLLDDYKRDRATGDKEHQRAVDKIFGGVSPQKQYGVPVALMFHEGAPRILKSGANIPWLRPTDDDRVIFEAYPGALARGLIGKASYKSDNKAKQSTDKDEARALLYGKVISRDFADRVGFQIQASANLVQDKSGDQIDALLCAVQAAYAWKHRVCNFGVPNDVDRVEGWIAGPVL